MKTNKQNKHNICPDGCGLEKPEISGFEPEVKHTATPWVLKKVDSIVGMEKRKSFQIVRPISETVICSGLRVEEGECIIRAVNSHEALLDAVRLARMLAEADYNNAIDTNASDIVRDAAFLALDSFTKAIAQAEGK